MFVTRFWYTHTVTSAFLSLERKLSCLLPYHMPSQWMNNCSKHRIRQTRTGELLWWTLPFLSVSGYDNSIILLMMLTKSKDLICLVGSHEFHPTRQLRCTSASVFKLTACYANDICHWLCIHNINFYVFHFCIDSYEKITEDMGTPQERQAVVEAKLLQRFGYSFRGQIMSITKPWE